MHETSVYFLFCGWYGIYLPQPKVVVNRAKNMPYGHNLFTIHRALMHLIISNSIFSRAFFGAGYFNAKKCFQILRKVTVTVCYGSSRAFFCLRSVLFCQKLKNNVRNILFVSTPIRIGENNRRFVKDCFVKRRIVKIVYIVMSWTKWFKWPTAANWACNTLTV
jgi:hypothetical protein